MWLWDRLAGRGRATGADTVGATTSPPAATTTAEAGWRQLEPIQRQVPAITPIAAAADFSGSLRTWHNPAILGELGHGVSPMAPSGLIDGLVEPISGSASQPASYPVARTLTLVDGAPARGPVQRIVVGAASPTPPVVSRQAVSSSSSSLSPSPGTGFGPPGPIGSGLSVPAPGVLELVAPSTEYEQPSQAEASGSSVVSAGQEAPIEHDHIEHDHGGPEQPGQSEQPAQSEWPGRSELPAQSEQPEQPRQFEASGQSELVAIRPIHGLQRLTVLAPDSHPTSAAGSGTHTSSTSASGALTSSAPTPVSRTATSNPAIYKPSNPIATTADTYAPLRSLEPKESAQSLVSASAAVPTAVQRQLPVIGPLIPSAAQQQAAASSSMSPSQEPVAVMSSREPDGSVPEMSRSGRAELSAERTDGSGAVAEADAVSPTLGTEGSVGPLPMGGARDSSAGTEVQRTLDTAGSSESPSSVPPSLGASPTFIVQATGTQSEAASSTGAQPAPEPPAVRSAPTASPDPGPTRRLGLGAPLTDPHRTVGTLGAADQRGFAHEVQRQDLRGAERAITHEIQRETAGSVAAESKPIVTPSESAFGAPHADNEWTAKDNSGVQPSTMSEPADRASVADQALAADTVHDPDESVVGLTGEFPLSESFSLAHDPSLSSKPLTGGALSGGALAGGASPAAEYSPKGAMPTVSRSTVSGPPVSGPLVAGSATSGSATRGSAAAGSGTSGSGAGGSMAASASVQRQAVGNSRAGLIDYAVTDHRASDDEATDYGLVRRGAIDYGLVDYGLADHGMGGRGEETSPLVGGRPEMTLSLSQSSPVRVQTLVRPQTSATAERLARPKVAGVPQLPTAQRLPGLPQTPFTPQMPGAPQLASVPQFLGVPQLPSVPQVPSMPQVPAALDFPTLPPMPTAPSVPTVPQMPAAPQAVAVPEAAAGSEVAVAPSVTTRSISASPAEPATAPPGMPAQLSTDELVRKLFDPLAARLKAELRLDRERAGLVTDLRR